ncbi:hypothetical protein [Micrococcus luteus]|uniref:hypothetical protein n=1 Tax=Micrococcus luteus TaxID=1270 RepID=UPI0036444393
MKLWKKGAGSSVEAGADQAQPAAEGTGRQPRSGRKPAGPERTGVNSAATRAMVAGVYGLIGLGALGGVVGVAGALSPAQTVAAPVQYVPTTSAEGAALTYVTAWLQATQTDQELVQEASGSNLPVAPMNRLRFSNVAVADAQRTQDSDVVAVTVSALVESVESDAADGKQKASPAPESGSSAAASPAGADTDAEKTAQEAKRLAEEAKQAAEGQPFGEDTHYEVHYWQVPVHVGDAGQVQVVGYPTPVPAPPRTDKELVLDYSERLDPTTELGQTVIGFLQSYAAGQGDASRYLAPASTVRGIDPAPYSEVHLMELRADRKVDDPGAGQPLRLLVQAEAELPSSEGDRQAITIALTMQKRDDRWEVTTVDPAPLITAKDIS